MLCARKVYPDRAFTKCICSFFILKFSTLPYSPLFPTNPLFYLSVFINGTTIYPVFQARIPGSSFSLILPSYPTTNVSLVLLAPSLHHSLSPTMSHSLALLVFWSKPVASLTSFVTGALPSLLPSYNLFSTKQLESLKNMMRS